MSRTMNEPTTLSASHVVEDHTSEVRMRVRAPSLEELFAQAGRGLAELIFGSSMLPEARSDFGLIQIRSVDKNALLVDWLNELVYRFETAKQLLTDFRFVELT